MLKYLNLPRVPDALLIPLIRDFDQFEIKAKYGNYHWSDSFNEDINRWCQHHISPDIYWAFQYMTGDVPRHKDVVTLTKFCYVIDSGGSNVITNFYENEQGSPIKSFVIEPHRWHILKVDSYHDVIGIQPGLTRFSITGRIFP